MKRVRSTENTEFSTVRNAMCTSINIHSCVVTFRFACVLGQDCGSGAECQQTSASAAASTDATSSRHPRTGPAGTKTAASAEDERRARALTISVAQKHHLRSRTADVAPRASPSVCRTLTGSLGFWVGQREAEVTGSAL